MSTPLLQAGRAYTVVREPQRKKALPDYLPDFTRQMMHEDMLLTIDEDFDPEPHIKLKH